MDLLIFEVGSYWHLPLEAIGRQPVRWLFSTYERIQRKRYNAALIRISEMEVAVNRALTRVLSKKGARLPPLPSYEEMVAEREEVRQLPKKPAWMLKYEEVNLGRRDNDNTLEEI